jgi:putative ABC transport system substrate-binding protein
VFVALIAVPMTAAGQATKKTLRVGFVYVGPKECPSDRRLESLHGELRSLGYVIGKNLVLDRRCFTNADEMRKLLNDFISERVDAILVPGPGPALAARALTREIPIVCASCGDPLDNGLVTSLARPDGNVTGFASLSAELIGKRLALLKEAIPNVSRIGALINPDNPGTRATLKALDDASKRLNVRIERIDYRARGDLENAFKTAASTGLGAIIVQDDPFATANAKRIADMALAFRLPASAGVLESAEAGLLMSYGVNREDLYRRMAGYIDRILKGTRPGDLPFEQAEKFDFIVNLKTAKAIGITMPQSVLVQATRVIQ